MKIILGFIEIVITIIALWTILAMGLWLLASQLDPEYWTLVQCYKEVFDSIIQMRIW